MRPGGDARRVIAIAKRGLTFTAKCIMAAVGRSMRWQDTLGERAGTFPYHCTPLAFRAAQGMDGVVHVR